jgi:hypothetical protein
MIVATQFIAWNARERASRRDGSNRSETNPTTLSLKENAGPDHTVSTGRISICAHSRQ